MKTCTTRSDITQMAVTYTLQICYTTTGALHIGFVQHHYQLNHYSTQQINHIHPKHICVPPNIQKVTNVNYFSFFVLYKTIKCKCVQNEVSEFGPVYGSQVRICMKTYKYTQQQSELTVASVQYTVESYVPHYCDHPCIYTSCRQTIHLF